MYINLPCRNSGHVTLKASHNFTEGALRYLNKLHYASEYRENQPRGYGCHEGTNQPEDGPVCVSSMCVYEREKSVCQYFP